MTTTEAPNGSRWFAWGEHWEVLAQTERDGEPAVELRLVRKNPKKKTTFPTITRLLLRRGIREEAL